MPKSPATADKGPDATCQDRYHATGAQRFVPHARCRAPTTRPCWHRRSRAAVSLYPRSSRLCIDARQRVKVIRHDLSSRIGGVVLRGRDPVRPSWMADVFPLHDRLKPTNAPLEVYRSSTAVVSACVTTDRLAGARWRERPRGSVTDARFSERQNSRRTRRDHRFSMQVRRKNPAAWTTGTRFRSGPRLVGVVSEPAKSSPDAARGKRHLSCRSIGAGGNLEVDAQQPFQTKWHEQSTSPTRPGTRCAH